MNKCKICGKDIDEPDEICSECWQPLCAEEEWYREEWEWGQQDWQRRIDELL